MECYSHGCAVWESGGQRVPSERRAISGVEDSGDNLVQQGSTGLYFRRSVRASSSPPTTSQAMVCMGASKGMAVGQPKRVASSTHKSFCCKSRIQALILTSPHLRHQCFFISGAFIPQSASHGAARRSKTQPKTCQTSISFTEQILLQVGNLHN